MIPQQATPPMLPAVRDALQPLLDHLPVEHRQNVRDFARHAGALGYANGYADGFEDGTCDVLDDDGPAELSNGRVVPLLHLVPTATTSEDSA